MSEFLMLLRNLCITLAVISVPLLLIWWMERHKLDKVKKRGENFVSKMEIGKNFQVDEDYCLPVVAAEKRNKICPIFLMKE